MKEISPNELKQKLESREGVAVLDIREADEYNAWHIEGSSNLPVYNALNRGNLEGLRRSASGLPKDRPIVAVCRRGNTSKLAVSILESLGYDAYSLWGGMRVWSKMWSEARSALDSAAEATFIQVRRNGKGCLSYVLGSRGEAIVVDPSLDDEVYLQIVQRENLRITRILETHVHADHLTRGRTLAETTGAVYIVPLNNRLVNSYTAIHDGDILTVGELRLRAITTPGHTHESMCYLINDEALLTGDTLFVESVGRPDLEKGDAGAEAGAAELYTSLHERIFSLAGSVRIFPTHTSKPPGFNGVPITARVDDVKASHALLNTGKEEFVHFILNSLSAKPPNFRAIIAVNEGKAELGHVDPLDLEAGPNRCAVG
jgi:glyoxylase-like metal-dependent hydrolase (beta-lactamase superfamily II)/rhodanese-related sulfurtransferase